jgi:CBS domain-containing protein
MRCEEIMRRPVEVARERESAGAAAMRMRDRHVGFLPVCDDGGRPVGALTDRDLAIRVCAAGRDPGPTRVFEVMTREVVACRPEDDVAEAEAQMARYRKSRVMVIERDGKLAGVISLADLVLLDAPHAARTLRRVARREVLEAGEPR